MKESDHLSLFPEFPSQSASFFDETEDRFREWADSMAQIIFELNERGFLIYSNRSAVLATGYTKGDIKRGLHVFQLIAPQHLEKLKKKISLISQGIRTEPSEYLILRKDKTSFPVLVHSSPVLVDGEFRGIRGLIMDISDRKTTEEALEASRASFFNIVERMEEGIVIVDVDGYIRYVNSAASAFLGYPPGVSEKTKFPHFAGSDHKKELFVDNSEGRRICLELTTLETEWQGEQAFLITVRDITERKDSELKILRNEANLQAMIDNLPHIAWLKDVQGRFVLINRVFLEKFHLDSPDLILGKTDLDLSEAGYASKYMEEDRKVMESGRSVRYEEIITEGDNTFWVEVYKRPVIDSQGNTIGTVGFARDLTQQRKDDKLRIHLIAAMEQAEEMIVLTDADGTIEFVNPAFERITGYSRDEVIGKNPRILKSGRHDAEFYDELWATITLGKTWHGRLHNRKKDGTLYQEQVNIKPMRDTGGEIMGFVAVKRDITEEVRMQSIVQQMQKTEALGRLAGGIAHDFNNILTAILGNASFASKYELPADHPARESLDQVVRGAHRARELVRQILTYSKGDRETPEPLHLGAVILEAVKLLRASLPPSVSLITEINAESDRILANSVQCHQIIMNLCTNAAQSLQNNAGTIVVSLNNTAGEKKSDKAETGEDNTDRELLRLEVRDDGNGMTREIQDHIFDPYFTTRPLSEGTGLGLSVVRGIVNNLGGNIRVQSEVGKGSVFSIDLPVCNEHLRLVPGDDEDPVESRGFEHILLVEDEPSLISILDKSLCRMGYTVTSYCDSALALESFLETPERFDLLIADLAMPLIRGEILAAKLRNLRPDLPIIFMTGYKNKPVDHPDLKEEAFTLLHKPVLPEDIHRAIRKIYSP